MPKYLTQYCQTKLCSEISVKNINLTAVWSQPTFSTKPVFKTSDLDIILDIYKCPFLKISVDFLRRFITFLKS